MEWKKKLLRQIKKGLGKEFIPPFSTDCDHLEGLSKSRYLDFLERVNKAYDEYEDRLNISYRNLKISTEEVDKKHGEISSLNSSLESILESLSEGLLVFGQDGKVKPTYSAICKDIFNKDVEGESILDLLRIEESDRATYEMWIQLIFQNKLDEEAMNSLGPQDFKSHTNRRYKITYKPILLNGAIDSVTVVVADNTANYEIKLKEQEQKRRAKVIDNIMKSRNDFDMFYSFFNDFTDKATDDLQNGCFLLKNFKLNLHTVKGSAAFFGLEDLTSKIQEIEERLKANNQSETNQLKLVKESLMILEDWRRVFNQEFKVILGQLTDSQHTKLIKHDEIVEIIDRNINDNLDREEWILEIVGDPIQASLDKLKCLADQTAKKLGKQLHPVKLECEEFKIISKHYRDLFNSLNHVVKNAVDHGIESPEERLSLGKSAKGSLEISARLDEIKDQKVVHFVFKDDGRGFAFDKLKKKLSEAGVFDLDDEKMVIKKMIENEVSTKSGRDEISGFGVGISAVVEEVQNLGGDFSIESNAGKGAIVTITVPRFYYEKQTKKAVKAA